jgi:hypothetical protein
MFSRFPRIAYSALNARQKENYNFQKISGVLADHGFATIRLSDDWNGADFIAQHLSGETLKVQLKARLCVYKKYCGRDLWVAFPTSSGWYLFPHDVLLPKVLELTAIEATESWSVGGGYSWPTVPASVLGLLTPYLFPAQTEAGAG